MIKKILESRAGGHRSEKAKQLNGNQARHLLFIFIKVVFVIAAFFGSSIYGWRFSPIWGASLGYAERHVSLGKSINTDSKEAELSPFFETRPSHQMQAGWYELRRGKSHLSTSVAVPAFYRAAFINFVSQ